MDLLQPGQIRVHLKDGNNYVSPEANKNRVVQCLGDSIARIEHFKQAVAPPAVAAVAAPVATKDARATLLGDLLKDGKIGAGELVTWIEASKSVEDLSIVMKGEGRATPKAAYKKRINELI